VAFSPDGSTLASACMDGAVWLWRADGTATVSVLRLPSPIRDLSWSGEHVAVASMREVVLLRWVHRS
jgi:WD40 repeat protein